MKLSFLYSNKASFKQVRFNERLNFILGAVNYAELLQKDTHNLGKTTILELIDFLLLKKISNDHFLRKHPEIFREYIFFLEIKLNSGRYLTIKRPVENDTRISFKLHNKRFLNLVNETQWDYEDLPLTSRKHEKNPVVILNRILGFDVISNYNYRKSLNYFLRTQYDYDDVFKLSKFRGRHSDWKPLLFELLGFDPKHLIERYKLEQEIKIEKQAINELQRKDIVSVGEIDKIKGLIDIKKEEAKNIQKQLDNFSFYFKERKLNLELVNQIEEKIAALNKLEYKISYQIEKIEGSLKNNLKFSLQEIEKLFNEVNIYFPQQLKKSYQELLDFNYKLIAERKKYLQDEYTKSKIKLNSIRKELKKLDRKRSEILSVLQSADSFLKFKKYQMQLFDIQKEISELEKKLSTIDVVKTIKSSIGEKQKRIEMLAEKILEQVSAGNAIYSAIRREFNHLFRETTGLTAILTIEINSAGYPEFKAEIADPKLDELTSKDQGFSYKKLLCACFDVAVLIVYSNKSFFRFVFHDGLFESLDNRKKQLFLQQIRNISQKYNIQYILTLIEHDSPYPVSEFDPDEIILKLTDEPNDKGRLFGFSF